MSLQAIAAATGGQVRGYSVIAPTPGHSQKDRGTVIRLSPEAPDGVLIHAFNGDQQDALNVKDQLRAAGILPEFGRSSRSPSARNSEAVEALKRNQAEVERARHLEAAKAVREALSKADPASSAHPYLMAKNIAPEALWQAGDVILVPMGDHKGLWNIQRIYPDGQKRFWRGARTKGVHWLCGDFNADRLVIAEGMATAAAIRRATGYTAIAAMSASNLTDVALVIRARRPDASIIIAADDDQTGHREAERAAKMAECALILPRGL